MRRANEILKDALGFFAKDRENGYSSISVSDVKDGMLR